MFHDIGPVNAEINMSARVRKCVHKWGCHNGRVSKRVRS